MKKFMVMVLCIGLASVAQQKLYAQAPQQSKARNTGDNMRKPLLGGWGFDLGGMDQSVQPGDDFFRYANGKWYDQAVIAPDRTGTGSFIDLDIQSEQQVQAILKELDARQNQLNPDEAQIRNLYRSYVDVAQLESLGLQPIQADLKSIADLKSLDDVARCFGMVGMDAGSLFNMYIGINDKNPEAYAVFIAQSGLGLPDRDYYLIDEKGIVAAREAYQKYIAQVLELGEIAEAISKAEAIFKLETEIAKIHWARAERRDADKMYNPLAVADLQKLAPEFPWATYLASSGITFQEPKDQQIIIGEKSAFPQLAKLFSTTPVEVWRDYLTFHYLSNHAAYLPQRFDDANFAFYGKVLGGQNEQLAREKRGVRFLSGMIGEGVGKLYVERHFSPEAKTKAQELVSNLLKVYHQRIETADWMSAETRQKALDKLGHFTVKIGYPDQWRDYSIFEVVADDLLGNAARGEQFEWHRRLARLHSPVDRSEWGMSPQTVNAYYEPTLNEIVFPAAILQPPFFDPYADDAVNYGGIGAVIGHEISHGFDDQGSKYNAQGVLANWWTPDDRKNFDQRTNGLVEQYSTYSPLEGMYVNGQLTLGENIADLAGVTVAFAAYQLSRQSQPAVVLDGFTGEQRFFLGFAQVWRYKVHDEVKRQRVLTDPHSPPQFRVNGSIRNVDGWYEAMKVNNDNKLYLTPDNRVKLW
ncbi:MAG: Neutral endopeptidase [Phycisphaerae bacterium]|nr:Neutral endopeptidase [Phycisphaerae bacterium]